MACGLRLGPWSPERAFWRQKNESRDIHVIRFIFYFQTRVRVTNRYTRTSLMGERKNLRSGK